MPLIPKVGQNRGKNLAILVGFYTVLALGSVTMIVPFLMTLTTSVTNQYDVSQYNIIPRFLHDDDALFIKYLFLKHERYDPVKSLYRVRDADTLTELSEAQRPLQTKFAPLEYDDWDTNKLAVARQDWEDFWNEARRSREKFPPVAPLFPAEAATQYQSFLRDRYLTAWRAKNPDEARRWDARAQERAALALLNSTYGATAGTEFRRIPMRAGVSEFGRLAMPDRGPRTRDLEDFLATLPAHRVTLVDADAAYQQFLREQHATLDKLNAAWSTSYRHFAEVQFSNAPPEPRAQRDDWTKFVMTRMGLAGVRLENRPSETEFRAWLVSKYGSLEQINRALKTSFRSLDEIPFPATLPGDRLLRQTWAAFAAERVPVAEWKFEHPLGLYHDFLRRRYGTIEKLAAAYGQRYVNFEEVRLPQAAFDRAEFLQGKRKLIHFFLTNNFTQVFQYIALQGRALWNTLFLVAASLAASLTINPMAAYALSRFKLKSKQAILICFLLPMAFPGEVASIPAFILTRDLGLLNTYWALILPGLANGFAIFMLKGFFDGLPRELYEAAALDGASEWTIYWNVTFPLCKPILALTVLGTVVASYSEFMWAFIICPDQEKWTLAVWIFQFSVDAVQRGQAHLQMAALVLMSIPTLIVFLFTQKIIMKGIILPTMK
jgi:multiple sugar transport system permease protein